MIKATEEQQKVLDAVASDYGDIKINALAGTGKTTTLKLITEANPTKTFLYIAFNKAVAKEASKKFPPNTDVFTVHGLAYRSYVLSLENIAGFHNKLSKRWKLRDYIERFKLEKLKAFIPNGSDFYIVANDIKRLVTKFKTSDAREINHSLLTRGQTQFYGSILTDLMVEAAKKIWEKEIDMDSDVPLDHNTYLKLWELTEPDVGDFDFILLDESQDANPAMLSVINKLPNIRKIYVGDTHQSIYNFNGAINAMSLADADHELYLTKSWRFGIEIAEQANKVLRLLPGFKKPITGNENIQSVIGTIDFDQQYTHIFRTNGALAQEAIDLLNQGKTVYVEGGVKDLCNDLLSLYQIKNRLRRTTSSKYSPFKNLSEVAEEAKVDITIKRDLGFIEKFGKHTPAVLENLKKQVLDKRSIKRANVILTTAHKSKGLEWPQVIVHDDFKMVFKPRMNPSEIEEWNLLYVSITRAVNNLYLKPGIESQISSLKGIVINEEI